MSENEQSKFRSVAKCLLKLENTEVAFMTLVRDCILQKNVKTITKLYADHVDF